MPCPSSILLVSFLQQQLAQQRSSSSFDQQLHCLSFAASTTATMKFNATIFGLTGLLGLALAAVPIKNDGISADIVVPEKYIVKYKASADAGRKKKHESDITNKAKKKNKKGVVESINIDGLSGYVAEIPDSELKELRDSDLVSGL